MNKYSEIEIETAKRLRDAGYKWIVRTFQGSVGAFSCKPCKKGGCWFYPSNLACTTGKTVTVSGKFTPLFQSIRWEDDEPTRVESIVHPQILDDAERRYLSAVIRPFRDRVNFICKENFMDYGLQYIVINLTGASTDMVLPLFKSGTMYKGMDLRKEYTLEELGL